MDIDALLKEAVSIGASDLHLSAGNRPVVRVDSELQRTAHPPIEESDLQVILKKILNDQQLDDFKKTKEVDLAFELADVSRFRVNVYHYDHGTAIAFRLLPNKIADFSALGLDPVHESLCHLRNGLVLVTGPTGSGKSTTLAAMIHYINATFSKHIITIEDPIEYRHASNKCLIHQREVGRDTKSFNDALRASLREDPDVLLVGEMRDLETIRLALTAAETGHLVFATLHTSSAPKTVSRIIDVFPSGEKALVQTMLSNTLEAVIGQELMKRIGGGRVAVQEVMICNSAIRNLIREYKIAQIHSAMQTGRSLGMHTMDQHITKLVEDGVIEQPEVYKYEESP